VATLTNPLSSGLALALFGHLRDEDSVTRANSRFRRSALATLALSSLAALIIAAIAPYLVRTAFGPQFKQATAAVRILLPGAVAFDILTLIGTKLFSEGRPGEASLAAALGAVVTVLGLIFFVPRFGIEGAAAVTSVAFISEVVFLVARGALHMTSSMADSDTEAFSEKRDP
nr:polysaccharide biosynthesis C-terminal domain-containing protein [Actinomycetota bacterium]